MNNNPLLSTSHLPEFSSITASHFEPALKTTIENNKALLEKLLARDHFTWDSLVQPFEEATQMLEHVWSVISHLNAVNNTPEIRDAYNQCLPLITQYQTEISQHTGLCNAIKSIKQSEHFQQLTQAQQQTINHMLRDFHLSGVDLPQKAKKKFASLVDELSTLQTKFEENILDATHAWHLHITNKVELAGIPEHSLTSIQHAAKQKNLNGWLVTLNFPIYYAVMAYADNENLRKKVYTAYNTRASEKEFDNSPIMPELLKIRQQLAELTGYQHYAEYSLASKMANNPKEVTDFIIDLAQQSKSQAEKELEALKTFAEKTAKESLNAWDLLYYSEKLRQEQFNISQESLRPYFPEDVVLQGLFHLVERLFDIHIQPLNNVETWQETVKVFVITDANKKIIAHFYTDLYARPGKRGGAWMSDCHSRFKNAKGDIITPVAFLNCNFTPPNKKQSALLTHDEVVTLFHEFGHCLHHMLTQVDVAAVSGINGVEWDAVEQPSQFLENWAWEPEVLKKISRHIENKTALPDEMIDKLLKAKNFQSGMQMLRQLEFALFDMKLHLSKETLTSESIQTCLDEVRKQIAVVFPPNFNRFQNSFSHIFAGGYAAGYYSYKWAELLSADCFSAFKEEGLFNPETGKRFLQCILAAGGSEDAMTLFKKFRGRAPSIKPLLQQSGISFKNQGK